MYASYGKATWPLLIKNQKNKEEARMGYFPLFLSGTENPYTQYSAFGCEDK